MLLYIWITSQCVPDSANSSYGRVSLPLGSFSSAMVTQQQNLRSSIWLCDPTQTLQNTRASPAQSSWCFSIWPHTHTHYTNYTENNGIFILMAVYRNENGAKSVYTSTEVLWKIKKGSYLNSNNSLGQIWQLGGMGISYQSSTNITTCLCGIIWWLHFNVI